MSTATMVSEEVLHIGHAGQAEDHLLLRAMDAALHDLSQPLTSIGLALEVVAQEKDPSCLEAMLVAARDECARAMRDVEMLRVQTSRLLARAEAVRVTQDRNSGEGSRA